MLRQYNAQRRKGGHNPRGVGVIDVGEIFYLADVRPMRGVTSPADMREPWQVVAFLPEKHPFYGPIARFDTVVLKSLRTGRERNAMVWQLLTLSDAGLEWMGPRKPRQVSQSLSLAA